jgi:hypothetical protein
MAEQAISAEGDHGPLGADRAGLTCQNKYQSQRRPRTARRWWPDTCVEFNNTRPGEGAVRAFAIRRSRDVTEGVLCTCRFEVTEIAAAAWTHRGRASSGPQSAENAERFEASGVALSEYDGSTEAALIAAAGSLLRRVAKADG